MHTVYDLLEAVAKDKVPTPNFEDGVKNQKVLDGDGEGRGDEAVGDGEIGSRQ